MKIELIIVTSSKEAWLDEALQKYSKKLSAFCEFKIISIKSKSLSRDQKTTKISYEEEKILNEIQPQDFVFVLDERGKPFDSITFSKKLQSSLESGKRRILFIIGGAFGLSDNIKSKAQVNWSLSSLTLSHHTAQVVFIEQLYRAFTILKNLPYHNP